MEPYVAERVTSSNWQSNNDSIQEEDQNRESESDENEDLEFDNDSILSNISATATGPNPNPNKSDNNSKVSAVTGRQQFEKGVNKRKAELETDLMCKLRDRLSSKRNDTKDEDQLWGWGSSCYKAEKAFKDFKA